MKALIIAALAALSLSSTAMASCAKDIRGECRGSWNGLSGEPANEAPKPQAEIRAEEEKPANPLDKIDTAIDTVNRIDRQGAELKRLFGK